MHVLIAEAHIVTPATWVPIPNFVIPDAGSVEDGLRTAALIIAAAAPRGTEINVVGVGDKTLPRRYVANGVGGID